MPLPSSGTIKLSDIKTEFGGATPPNNLGSYRRGQGYVPDTPVNASVPSTYPITIRDFYGSVGDTITQQTITIGFNSTTSGYPPYTVTTVTYGYSGSLGAISNGYWKGYQIKSITMGGVTNPTFTTFSIYGVRANSGFTTFRLTNGGTTVSYARTAATFSTGADYTQWQWQTSQGSPAVYPLSTTTGATNYANWVV